MDRLTRKSLKTDKFAAEVGHTVEFLEEHRKQAIIAGVALLVVIVGAAGMYFHTKKQHAERQEALRNALAIFQAQISPTPNAVLTTFPTEEKRDEAVEKAFTGIVEKYPGSVESAIATYYLGVAAGNQGKEDEAEKRFREVIDSGKQPFASQAALSLATLKASLGDQEEAEKILRGLIEHPTVLVSKEQATIALARILAGTNPSEARKLLEPLRGERSAVSRAALTALGEIGPAE